MEEMEVSGREGGPGGPTIQGHNHSLREYGKNLNSLETSVRQRKTGAKVS